jgi:hypothetical protein
MPDASLASVMTMAVARRDLALREVDAWNDFIRRLETLGYPPVGFKAPVPPSNQAASRQRKPEPDVARTIEESSSFLEALGRAAPTRELYDEMIRRGVMVGGKDPKRTLDARLRYSGVFKNLAGRGWWFVNRPLPDENNSAVATNEVATAVEDQP